MPPCFGRQPVLVEFSRCWLAGACCRLAAGDSVGTRYHDVSRSAPEPDPDGYRGSPGADGDAVAGEDR